MNLAPPKLQEPSMDDILASIRRIISEDQISGLQAATGKPSPRLGEASRDETPRPRPLPFPVREEPPKAPAEPPSAAPSGAVAPALVSGETQTAVGDAFARLAATPVAPPMRGLEEAVTEMLRPMLQTWLDDNLPSLVERLVKAEIERLTRNGR